MLNRFIEQWNWHVLTGMAGLLAGLVVAGMAWYRTRHQLKRSTRLTEKLNNIESLYTQEQATNQANNVFFANMSHELRTPFQGLLGMLDLIGEGHLDDDQRSQLNTAKRSAQHLLGVLNDILDVSSMDAGTFRLTRNPLSVRQLMQDVEGLMKPQALQQGLSLATAIEPDVALWVTGDETRVRQILFNLLSNAIKFTPKGRISVRVRNSQSHANGLVIAVADTGMGMDAQTQGQLFTRFFQADASKKRRVGGTGLGLEISRNLARMMNGDIHVQSEIGRGTTFTALLILPACAPPEDSQNSVLLGSSEVSHLLPPVPIDVLVADDHPVNREYLEQLLRKMGHRVTVVGDGSAAVELACRRRFDALLLDYHMPEMDGLEATRIIRAGAGPSATSKIFLITADVVNSTRDLALLAGVNAFLRKPLQRNELHRTFLSHGLLVPEMYEEAPHEVSGLASRFPMSNYEAPMLLTDAGVEATPAANEWVDWSVVQQIKEFMSHDLLQEKLDSVISEKSGGVASTVEALRSANVEHQAFALHKFKGSTMLLGLSALSQWAEKAQDELRATPQVPLGRSWEMNLIDRNEKTRKELSRQFRKL